MLITFTENVKYTEDGHVVKQGHKDETRDVAHAAASDLLRKGKAYNAEEPTGNYDVDKTLDDIQSIICQIDHWHTELHKQMDELNKVLLPLPNKALRGTYLPGMEAVRQSEES